MTTPEPVSLATAGLASLAPRASQRAAAPEQVLELLDAAIAECRRLGRPDLAKRLEDDRAQVNVGLWHVLVAGEFKKGKSTFVNALLNLPVCGADAVAFTAVPTIVRYGAAASAGLVLDDGGEASARRRGIPVRDAAKYALAGIDDDGARLYAVEIELPRELLRAGLVLVDTPGLGGGFAAAQAAATMRAMSLANAVVVVSDASQEYTKAEVEFLRHAAQVCPSLLCALTKTDFYPEWRRILDINQGHLRRAGLDVEIIPVSSRLRDLGVETGDPALNAESGFPVVVDRLRARLAALGAEHAALTRPEERPATIRRADDVQRRAERLSSPSARWQNLVLDRFADIQSKLDADLQARIRRLDEAATKRIREGDPTREWAEITPWLYRRTNEELTDCHARLLAQINAVAGEVAELFEDEATDIRNLTGAYAPGAGESFKLDRLSTRDVGKLETGMHAARGWSLSSSVVTTVLIATLHPGLLVILPITAALGSVFALKAVRSIRHARIEQGRNEALRAVATYLNQARMDAGRASADMLRHSRARIRDYYTDRAQELLSTAQQGSAAVHEAAVVDPPSADRRAAETEADLARVHALLDACDRLEAAR